MDCQNKINGISRGVDGCGLLAKEITLFLNEVEPKDNETALRIDAIRRLSEILDSELDKMTVAVDDLRCTLKERKGA